MPPRYLRSTSLGLRLTAARRGVAVVYMIVLFAGLCGLVSLAADFGHAELVKTELRRCADATAHDYMQLYTVGGVSYANLNGPQTYSAANNPVDGSSTVQPTVTVVWGRWISATSQFKTTGSAGDVAVKVTVSRTSANNNAVPLMFGKLLGMSGVDVSASAVAADVAGPTVAVTVPASANPYFAGMPSGTTNAYGDNMTNNAPMQVTSIPVTPGTYLTFSGFTGTSSVLPGTMPYAGASGVSGFPYGTATHHGENWDGGGTPGGYTENGIADAVMPESSLMGLFLGSSAPNTNSAPPTVDWTQASMLSQTDFNSIALQQPFYIGDGVSSGGTVQKFLVPPGATRFYVGIWDGLQYSNNAGSISGTITLVHTVQIVQ